MRTAQANSRGPDIGEKMRTEDLVGVSPESDA